MSDFKKYIILHAEPEIVYAALTNEATLQLWTGEPAEMGTEPGSEFSLWEGSISGTNVEFTPGKKLVQHWDFGEQDVPSIVSFICHAHAQGTSLEIKHQNIPEEAFDDIREGWETVFIPALQSFYE